MTDTAALLCNLQKNEELKSILLQETPWVMQAKNESEQKKNIALLFDMVKLSGELEKNLGQLDRCKAGKRWIRVVQRWTRRPLYHSIYY